MNLFGDKDDLIANSDPELVEEAKQVREQLAEGYRKAFDAKPDTKTVIADGRTFVDVDVLLAFNAAMGQQAQVEAMMSMLGDEAAPHRLDIYSKVMTMLDVFRLVALDEPINAVLDGHA